MKDGITFKNVVIIRVEMVKHHIAWVERFSIRFRDDYNLLTIRNENLFWVINKFDTQIHDNHLLSACDYKGVNNEGY